MSATWHSSPDASAAAQACADQTLGLLDDALSRQDSATLAVSGGSTPKLLFERLAASRFHWDRVHLFWVDERCVPPHDVASNYRLAEEHLIRPAQIPQRLVHRVHGEFEPREAAIRYVAEMRAFFGLGQGEVPQFDIVQCGLGPDGHTASLFPGSPLLSDREGMAAEVFAPQFQQWRVTLLPAVLLAAKHTLFLVTGRDKAAAVRDALQGEYDPLRHPAQPVSRQGRNVSWLLDSEAAGLLE